MGNVDRERLAIGPYAVARHLVRGRVQRGPPPHHGTCHGHSGVVVATGSPHEREGEDQADGGQIDPDGDVQKEGSQNTEDEEPGPPRLEGGDGALEGGHRLAPTIVVRSGTSLSGGTSWRPPVRARSHPAETSWRRW